jgi:hypothetical protein
MTKETFIELMKDFIKIKEDEEELNKAFKNFEPDFNYISFGRYKRLFLKTIKEAMDDEYDWIDYFIYERDCKFTNKSIVRNKDGKNLPFRNFTNLWNLIKLNY